MKLTRKKAIELCIELWEWLAETGKRKEDWPERERYQKYCKPVGTSIMSNCWFCEYDYQHPIKGDYSSCPACPLIKHSGFGCEEKGSYYLKWSNAKTLKTRKKYAKLFLEQIKTLRK